ncbi:F0F1 ATP synthase subunit B [Lactobacillus delbrueckii subsp. lactis]|jgi:F-type H+-transporting ATPase subunit b|uniref:ATP synthase subunit b n=1 Tax=Lactobacillus delbrueckii subsp. delbrueckii TaxID=83684 RepID=A0AAU9R1Y4_9LACO|nr:F0F1 ATP synthase subunit B [Lactobacillus delbrueckii]ADQ60685.1 ATP synthase subunit b [Lactobacillus delbrueckii subsp. bulgaricus ND02]APP09477.1 ATP synthase F0 subunit B [Lactobacillus delbrueckii subsp. delbrueckii DSM 20074 = JCM 1012]KNZ38328.1 ATP synthase F0F1 subunit B [Lactobacillus delbrueckii subsp. delbrueckii]MBO3081611.1 F0F1 ATP synthase subunit B [Lactobacillus delbrueckii subsp. bulgaricus]MCD5437985.1 F0F1 ATP synthase subunit B [Lactobacillus delbrueckii subsp. lactis
MEFQPVFAGAEISIINTLWYLIVFSILLLAVKHYAWGPVKDMMEKRRQKVIDDLDQAASDRKKAEILANEREAALKNSRQEATQILSVAKSNAQKTGKQIVSEAKAEASAIRERAKADAAQAKSDALNEARNEVADLSVTIAEKVIAKNLSAADQKDLVDQFIKGLND